MILIFHKHENLDIECKTVKKNAANEINLTPCEICEFDFIERNHDL